MAQTPSTRDRLVTQAALLFQRKGYHGVGMAEILDAAQAPKGSLYHHFPNGKSDLALAAAHFAADQMLQILDASFKDADSLRDGVTTFCYKLAKLFDINDKWIGCPVSATLFESPTNTEFRQATCDIFQMWLDATVRHATSKGATEAKARALADALWMTLQGAWSLSRVRGSSDPIKTVPALVLRDE
ncbi:TetR/AcrR family transcriptional regulator [Litoreibacter albidus]|uniref:Transcriptional regulator, TetR family n=1 Tax=Litoreibacter albidus TaxID=670155 RepID=A0A1H3C8A6_9RHOB|nr:TetR/AcrR family transcriptional regulator [Litoreibacter albidus]SDX50392.1 transcriptional regulator, TetR family [Litoreibacter albidus]